MMVDVESLDRAECAQIFVITSKDKDDAILKKTTATLASGYIKLHFFVNAPFIF